MSSSITNAHNKLPMAQCSVSDPNNVSTTSLIDTLKEDQKVLKGPQTFWSDPFRVTIAVLALHLTYFVAPMMGLIVPLVLLAMGYWATTVLLVVTYIWWSFDGSERRLGRPCKPLGDLWMWRIMGEAFPFTLEREGAPLDPSKQYIFAVHPHGFLCVNRCVLCLCRDLRWDKVFPGIETRDLAASVCFKVPFMREVWLWTACVDASRKTAERVLRSGMNLLLYPGGIEEQLETQYQREQVFLRKRHGFVRLALQHGAHLVPIYAFGETDLYRELPIFVQFRRWLYRRWRVGIPCMVGQYGLAPFLRPLACVAGQPIALPRIENPSSDEIEHYHQLYIQRLRLLFDTHKWRFGMGHRELEVM